MKILAIIGSPRNKGNTYKVTKEVEERMKQIGNVEFEYLFLKDADLKMCSGCFNCVSKGKELCPLKDEMAEIENKMMGSDGIIFATPVYCENVSGYMKNFIDRFAYVFHRPQFFDQKAMVLATSAGGGLKDTLDYLKKLQIWGFGTPVELSVMMPPWPQSDALQKKNKKNINKTTEEFYEKLQEGRQSPNFMQYMHFRFIKETSKLGYLPADLEFYKDKDEYFYDTKISPLKKILAPIIMKFAFFMMRDLEPNDKKK
ncbi:MAG TPA: NAD(P)H-dependent oxidoreductase [Methanobacterium sp.]|nr:NAD(P)H-dependent oxidoreductase [Methanobacterium sp.]